MAKREWGAKHSCDDCGVKFYDLHRNPIACPGCGSVVKVETAVRPNRRRPSAQPERPPPANATAAAAPGAAGAVGVAAAADAVDPLCAPDETPDEGSNEMIGGGDDDPVGDMDIARPAPSTP